MKHCCGCKEEKDLSKFYKDRSRPDGKDAQCKECRLKIRRGEHVSKPKPGYPRPPTSELDRMGLSPWGYATARGPQPFGVAVISGRFA